MSKQIIICVLTLAASFLGTKTVKAQANSDPANTTVNLLLADIISIDQGSIASDGTVNFNYLTSTDYNTIKTKNVTNGLIVTSSTNFEIKVKADDEFFENGGHFIPVNILQVKAAPGGTMDGAFQNITLSTTDQVLVGLASKGALKSLNIDYSISAEKAQTVLLGKAPGTYTQKVKYTATAL